MAQPHYTAQPFEQPSPLNRSQETSNELMQQFQHQQYMHPPAYTHNIIGGNSSSPYGYAYNPAYGQYYPRLEENLQYSNTSYNINPQLELPSQRPNMPYPNMYGMQYPYLSAQPRQQYIPIPFPVPSYGSLLKFKAEQIAASDFNASLPSLPVPVSGSLLNSTNEPKTNKKAGSVTEPRTAYYPGVSPEATLGQNNTVSSQAGSVYTTRSAFMPRIVSESTPVQSYMVAIETRPTSRAGPASQAGLLYEARTAFKPRIVSDSTPVQSNMVAAETRPTSRAVSAYEPRIVPEATSVQSNMAFLQASPASEPRLQLPATLVQSSFFSQARPASQAGLLYEARSAFKPRIVSDSTPVQSNMVAAETRPTSRAVSAYEPRIVPEATSVQSSVAISQARPASQATSAFEVRRILEGTQVESNMVAAETRPTSRAYDPKTVPEVTPVQSNMAYLKVRPPSQSGSVNEDIEARTGYNPTVVSEATSAQCDMVAAEDKAASQLESVFETRTKHDGTLLPQPTLERPPEAKPDLEAKITDHHGKIPEATLVQSNTAVSKDRPALEDRTAPEAALKTNMVVPEERPASQAGSVFETETDHFPIEVPVSEAGATSEAESTSAAEASLVQSDMVASEPRATCGPTLDRVASQAESVFKARTTDKLRAVPENTLVQSIRGSSKPETVLRARETLIQSSILILQANPNWQAGGRTAPAVTECIRVDGSEVADAKKLEDGISFKQKRKGKKSSVSNHSPEPPEKIHKVSISAGEENSVFLTFPQSKLKWFPMLISVDGKHLAIGQHKTYVSTSFYAALPFYSFRKTTIILLQYLLSDDQLAALHWNKESRLEQNILEDIETHVSKKCSATVIDVQNVIAEFCERKYRQSREASTSQNTASLSFPQTSLEWYATYISFDGKYLLLGPNGTYVPIRLYSILPWKSCAETTTRLVNYLFRDVYLPTCSSNAETYRYILADIINHVSDRCAVSGDYVQSLITALGTRKQTEL